MKTITKAEAVELAKYYDYTTSYSGVTRTLHIHGDNARDAIITIKARNPVFNIS